MIPISARYGMLQIASIALFCSVALAEDSPFLKRPARSFVGAKAGQVRDDNGLKMKLVWCPPGKFMMGSPKDEKKRNPNESQVEVTLTKGFWLGKYEVTQGQWKRVMRTTPWRGKKHVKVGDEYPVTYVSWLDEVQMCSELTSEERRARRLTPHWIYTLPTEAQWEYACRAGTTTRSVSGDSESDLSKYAWFSGVDTDLDSPQPVGQKKANAFGLYDMHGNVYEWCRDWYSDRLPGGTDPEVTVGRWTRVYRSGSWSNGYWDSRSAFRGGSTPDFRNEVFGFRVALVQSAK
jgi:formylglycine-generating enzyme